MGRRHKSGPGPAVYASTMHLDTLDVVLLVAVVLFGLSGYRQGFIIGLLSLAGFLGGGALGAVLSPTVADHLGGNPALIALLTVLVVATLGQALAAGVGASLRRLLVVAPGTRTLDSLAGAGVSVISVLAVAWLVGTAVVASPFPTLVSQVQRSVVLGAVDQAVPDQARTAFSAFRRLVDRQEFPQVFGGLGSPSTAPVQPPDPAVAGSQAVTTARPSVVKIRGTACQEGLEGSGFVIATDHVMTNAHVVAGVQDPAVVVDGRRRPATVVYYDPDTDVAVLRVEKLGLKPLRFAAAAKAGDSAVVVGYPQDGPFTAVAARVRGGQNARGPNIYQTRTVTRQIYALRAQVRPGNSGGPLLAPDGSVYGVVFAAAADDPDTGYALTAQQVSAAYQQGRSATAEVSTQQCD